MKINGSLILIVVLVIGWIGVFFWGNIHRIEKENINREMLRLMQQLEQQKLIAEEATAQRIACEQIARKRLERSEALLKSIK